VRHAHRRRRGYNDSAHAGTLVIGHRQPMQPVEGAAQRNCNTMCQPARTQSMEPSIAANRCTTCQRHNHHAHCQNRRPEHRVWQTPARRVPTTPARNAIRTRNRTRPFERPTVGRVPWPPRIPGTTEPRMVSAFAPLPVGARAFAALAGVLLGAGHTQRPAAFHGHLGRRPRSSFFGRTQSWRRTSTMGTAAGGEEIYGLSESPPGSPLLTSQPSVARCAVHAAPSRGKRVKCCPPRSRFSS